MTIKEEISIRDFEFWGNAKANASKITEEEWNAIEWQLEELYPTGIDRTELNDMFAYYIEDVLGLIGVTEEEWEAR